MSDWIEGRPEEPGTYWLRTESGQAFVTITQFYEDEDGMIWFVDDNEAHRLWLDVLAYIRAD